MFVVKLHEHLIFFIPDNGPARCVFSRLMVKSTEVPDWPGISGKILNSRRKDPKPAVTALPVLITET